MNRVWPIVLCHVIFLMACSGIPLAFGPATSTPTLTPDSAIGSNSTRGPVQAIEPLATTQPGDGSGAVGSRTTVYTVQSGDTIGKIAKRFGVSVDAIVAANDITDRDVIQVEQQLVIPIEPAPSPERSAVVPSPTSQSVTSVEERNTNSSSTVSADSADRAPPTPSTTIAEPIVFSGRGPSVTDEFAIAAHPFIFDVTHTDASGNFAVWLKDTAERDPPQLIANTAGPFEDIVTVEVNPGRYYLEITTPTNGKWQIVAQEPAHLSRVGIGESYEFSDTSSTVTPLFLLIDGEATAELQHDGQRNFVVDIYGVGTDAHRLLVNEIGAVDLQLPLQLDQGWYFFNVVADGAWAIRVQQ